MSDWVRSRITRGKQRSERTALRNPKQGSALDAHRVHDGAQIVHALVHVRQVRNAVGEPGATLIETNDADKSAKFV